MKINDLNFQQKLNSRKEYNNKNNILNYIFYSVRNIYIFVFERNIECYFKNKGYNCQVKLDGNSRYETVEMVFQNKSKKLERVTFLKRKSVGYTDFGRDVADIFLINESICSSQYYGHKKSDFDIGVDNLLSSKEFELYFKNKVFSDLNYPFGEYFEFDEKMKILKSETSREEFCKKLIVKANDVLPLYYKGLVEHKLQNKKYSIKDFTVFSESFVFIFESNKKDIFELTINFKKELDLIKNIEVPIYIANKIDINLISRGENNKKSIKAINEEILSVYDNKEISDFLIESINIINFPYTYESKLSS